MKLHLGCGMRYLDGYTNIDFPISEQTVLANVKADLFCDINALRYSPYSIDEIRLHHVFEHFSRPVALALLCKWRDWLRPGGLLRIETPDAMACCKSLTRWFVSYDQKQQILRHLFGSHEAAWAVHCDGWYKEKFSTTLSALGYERLRFFRNSWGKLCNIEVQALKSDRNYDVQSYSEAVTRLLRSSTVRVRTQERDVPEGSEAEMLHVWKMAWENAYLGAE